MPAQAGPREVEIPSPGRPIRAVFHPSSSGNTAVLWVFGAGGGLGGPAGGLYVRLAELLVSEDVASLRLDYRYPGNLRECVRDVAAGLRLLEQQGRTRVVLVGHSFGGAVVIQAGCRERSVIAVAALSSQTHGVADIRKLSPRPLLLIHGTADEVLPDSCSRALYAMAMGPKELVLYQGCRHGLDDCREEVDRDLTEWLRKATETGQKKRSGQNANLPGEK